ncbi:MAG: response regulator [Alphaproteobacteria bacterium]|nr:response regulator [Alphaproteobacteria bacterium]
MLDSFFITSRVTVAEDHGTYSYALVALSFVVASLASYLALVLARYLAVTQNRNRRRLLQWGGALALGTGIWAMHFIGMLAFRLDMPVEYDPELTIGSLVVAILSAYGVLLIVGRTHLKIGQIAGSAILLGAGISSMHYMGMAAMVMDADMRYRPDIFALSIAIAIGASAAALWLCFTLARHTGKARKWLEMGGALIMAVAICGMHYTGMAAAVFIPHMGMLNPENNFTTSGIALGVAIVGAILSLALPVIVYQMIKDDQDNEDMASAFPTRLLSFTVVCTFAVLAGLAGYGLHSRHLLETGLTVDGAQNLAIHLGWMSFVAIAAATILAIVWYFALRSIKHWRRELYSNKTLLSTVIENMPLALFAKDAADGYRWLLLNHTAEEMFCLKRENIVGRQDSEFFPATEADFFRKTDERVMANGKLVDIEAEPITTPKGTFMAHTIKVPIYDAHGQPHILLGMTEDVTEKAKAKEELRQAKERAEESDRAKSEFLANMSHELRTPLNSILGMTRLLCESSANADQRALAETAFTSSGALLEIVNDILDLSKIEANALQMEKIGFDLSYILHAVIDRLTPLAREKKLSDLVCEDSSPPYVVGDPTRLTQVLTNLVSNAIKYTNQGGVRIVASHKFLDDGRILYRCEIIDTGIGIPANKHAHVFEKFTQADTSTTRKYGGTGLGLAITKQLVELMGGTLGLTSVVGKGSTFWFEIPFTVTGQLHREKGSQRQIIRHSAMKPSEVRVLVAEDHPVNQTFITRLLQRFGIQHFKIVPNGAEALQAYQTGNWDMILMDCHMPEKNGYDATIDIRALEKTTGRHVPIIAMTANAMIGDREKCLRCGMDDYISKPIVIEELAKLMGQWIDLKAFETAGPTPAPHPTSCIDLSHMRTFTDGSKEMEAELIRLFINQSEVNMQTLLTNQMEGSHKAWMEAAHMLKGGAASIGAEELQLLCAKAQAMSTATVAQRVTMYVQINDAYARVKQALQAENLLD